MEEGERAGAQQWNKEKVANGTRVMMIGFCACEARGQRGEQGGEVQGDYAHLEEPVEGKEEVLDLQTWISLEVSGRPLSPRRTGRGRTFSSRRAR